MGKFNLTNNLPAVKLSDGSTNTPLGTAGNPLVTTGGGGGGGTVDQGTGGVSPWVQNLVQVGGSAVSLGQKTSANSIPVTMSSDQSPIAITGSITATNPSVSTTGAAPPASATYMGGSVTTSAPTYTTGQMSALSLTISGGLRVDGSGYTQPVSGTFWQATQPVSMAASVAVTQSGVWSTGRTWTLTSGTDSITIVPSGTQTVAGTVTATQGTSPWVDNITQIGGSSLALGQTTMSASLPVAIASNQSALPVSQSGSWTVTANAGTNLNTSALALDTSVNGILLLQGSTTSGQKGTLSQGAVTTSAPTYITGQTSPLSLTTTGALRIDGSATTQPVSVSGTVAVTQSTSPWVVSGTVTANAGTGNFTVVQSTAANLNATVTGTVAATQSGIWTVQQGSAPWSQNLTQVGGASVTLGSKTSANSVPVVIASDQGAVPVSGTFFQATQPVSGTVTANQGGSWTVTANAGTNLNTSLLALDASVNGILVAQSSNTSGQSGPLIQGAVTTGSPTYTTAKTSPLSLTTAGALRTDGSAVTQPVSGTFFQATQPVSIAGTVNTSDTHTTAAAPLATELSDGAAFYVAAKTGQFPSALVGGRLDANIGAWLGSTVPSVGSKTSANSIPVVIASDQAAIPVSQSGSWTVIANAGTNLNTSALALDATLTGGTQTTRITDGTNTAAVKAASIAPVAADKALVVAVSPNSLPLSVSLGDGPILDAFGRLRIAEPVTLFSAQFQNDIQPLAFQTSVSGTGTVTKTANESSLTLSTGGTANGATAINQTKQYIHYQPGKSHQILMTGILGAQKSNVRSRIGYFDANDGIYFEMDGTGGAAVVQRSSTSGSPVNTVVLQASWNVDKMNGSGASGITLDFSKTQIFHIDMQWLGVGRVRLGVVINGILYVVHQFLNANSITSPYINSANLPCRAEITNTGVAGSTTTMKQVCIAVSSESGSSSPSAFSYTANNGVTSINSANGVRTPILSIRPKTTFNAIANRIEILLESFEIINSGGQNILWELVYNGTLTGTSFTDVDTTNSCMQKDVTATAITNGTVVGSGYIGGGGKISGTVPFSSQLPFTLDLAGAVADIYTLCGTSFGANAATNCAITWQENK